MKTFPSLDVLREYRDSGLYTMAALTTELYADIRTPVEVLRILRARGSHCFLFESAEDKERWGRYSFLGFDPGLTISCRDGELKIGEKTSRTAHPKKEIRELMRNYRATLPTTTSSMRSRPCALRKAAEKAFRMWISCSLRNSSPLTTTGRRWCSL